MLVRTGLLSGLLALGTCVACKTTSTSRPSAVPDKSFPSLGTLYKPEYVIGFHESCVDTSSLTDADFSVIGPKSGTASVEFSQEFLNNENWRQPQPKMSIGANQQLDFSSSTADLLRLEAGAADITRAASVNLSGGGLRIKSQSLHKIRFTAKASALLGKVKSAVNPELKRQALDDFRTQCGEGFLAGYSLGYNLASSLKYTFANVSDSLRYGSLISAGNFEENLRTTSIKFPVALRYESLAVNIPGFPAQDYGDVASLECSLEFKPCLEKFQNFVERVVPALIQ